MAGILVIGETGSERSALALALRRHGHEVNELTACEHGAAPEANPAPEVVIAQVGPEVSRVGALRSRYPEADVLVTRPGGSTQDAVRAMRLGARDYLSTGEVDEVVRAVAELLTERDARRESARAPTRDPFAEIKGNSRSLKELLALVAKVAETDSTVLITGETGTGKELIGAAIHGASHRADQVFSAVNSAAFPETLLESELFGHRRGAFTGAATNKTGLFESAHRGTVFLDEVAEMPLSMQAKLLRFLQTGEIRPVGSSTTRRVDVRLVAATNKDLEREVTEGRFREDLYYRLAVIPVEVMPMRERAEDIPVLAVHFLRRFSRKLGKHVREISPEALDLMSAYAWPGNVRELMNCIERAIALCRGDRITAADLPPQLAERPAAVGAHPLQSLRVLERSHILNTLEHVGWNRKRAAEILEISTTTLWRRLKEFGIEGRQESARRA